MGIRLESLYKTFHTNDLTVEALRDVSATIQDSEFVSIIGPSGCGKSTLLRLVSGFSMRPGQAMIAGTFAESS